MAAEDSRRPYPRELDPSIQTKADQFFNGIAFDRNQTVERVERRAEEERQSMVTRINEVKELGLELPDQLWSMQPDSGALSPELDPEISPIPAIVLEEYIDFTSAFMREDGRVFTGKYGVTSDPGNGELNTMGWRVNSIDFNSVSEVSVEDYPKFAGIARDVLEKYVEKQTGVTRMQLENTLMERNETERERIEEANRRYKNVKDFSNESGGEITNDIMDRISLIHGMVKDSESRVNPDQLSNILGHIFSAKQFHDQDHNIYKKSREEELVFYGAYQLNKLAGHFIFGLSPELGSQVTKVGRDLNRYAKFITDGIIRHYQIPFQSNPDNIKIYEALGRYYEEQLEEHHRNRFAEDNPVPEAFQTEDGEVITAGQITEWLLNTPPLYLSEI